MAGLELVPNIYMVVSQAAIFACALVVVKHFFIEPFKELTKAKANSTTDLLKKAKELEEKSCVMLAQIEKNVRDKTLAIQQKAQEIRLKALEQAQINIDKERVKNEDFIKSFCADLKQQKKEQMPLVVEQSQKIAKETLAHLLQK